MPTRSATRAWCGPSITANAVPARSRRRRRIGDRAAVTADHASTRPTWRAARLRQARPVSAPPLAPVAGTISVRAAPRRARRGDGGRPDGCRSAGSPRRHARDADGGVDVAHGRGDAERALGGAEAGDCQRRHDHLVGVRREQVVGLAGEVGVVERAGRLDQGSDSGQPRAGPGQRDECPGRPSVRAPPRPEASPARAASNATAAG